MRKPHGRARAGLQLFRDGAFVLPENIGAAAGLDLASFQIEQQLDLPTGKGVPRRLAALHLSDEPPEAIEHQLAFFQVIVSGHVASIGSRKTIL